VKGNDRERQRNRIEDKIIEQLDRCKPVWGPCVAYVTMPLTVKIIDLLAYKAARFGMVIKAASRARC